MYFSASTIALVATLGLNAIEPVSAAAVERSIEQRGFIQLFNLQNYGAIGYPWETNSKPGSFCGSNKPSNNRAWQNLPYFDGGDKLRCTWWNSWFTPICWTGNKRVPLPWGCKPPKKGGSKPPTSSVKSSASSAAASSAASSGAPSSDAATSSTSSAPPATSSAAPDPNPYNDPVCQGQYQTTYLNYTLVAPNGYWYGKTVGAATQDASYLTYTLATNVADCLDACSKIDKCVFVNTYFDHFDLEADLPKHTPGVLTCAMFSSCVGTEKNDNWGGQDDPNVIENSNGYCRSGACGGA